MVAHLLWEQEAQVRFLIPRPTTNELRSIKSRPMNGKGIFLGLMVIHPKPNCSEGRQPMATADPPPIASATGKARIGWSRERVEPTNDLNRLRAGVVVGLRLVLRRNNAGLA